MKKTREALVEFLQQYDEILEEHIVADELIKEGWAKLDEPREWWIVCDEIDGYVKINEEQARATNYKEFSNKGEIIHVREVVDND